jgi:hypothetical protein
VKTGLKRENDGDDETRTRDLCRDRAKVYYWRKQNQQVTCAVVGNCWLCRAALGAFVQRFVQRGPTLPGVGSENGHL